MALSLQQEHCFAGSQVARLEGHGKVDLSKVGGKMLILSCTSSYQTGAKYLKTGKQIPVARRL